MKKFLALVLSLCLVLSLAACGGKPADDDTAEGSKTGGTIQVGLNSAPVSMNIWCQNDLNSATIMNLVCPNLVAIDDDGNKYDYLTESSEANEDCTVWTIKLKELYWNDGTPSLLRICCSPPSTVWSITSASSTATMVWWILKSPPARMSAPWNLL